MPSIRPQSFHPLKVLMYVEHAPMAARLANLLAANEIEATLVDSDEGFDQMVASGDFDSVVTSTRLIGKICLQLPLPIVNVERFVFTITDHPSSAQSKRFDGQKFVAEIFAARDADPLRQAVPRKSSAAQQHAAM